VWVWTGGILCGNCGAGKPEVFMARLLLNAAMRTVFIMMAACRVWVGRVILHAKPMRRPLVEPYGPM
jgi:hypothetical protein